MLGIIMVSIVVLNVSDLFVLMLCGLTECCCKSRYPERSNVA